MQIKIYLFPFIQEKGSYISLSIKVDNCYFRYKFGVRQILKQVNK